MFAYSQVGRLSAAIGFGGYLLCACLIANVLLQFFRAGVAWWGLAALGALSSFLAWQEVVAWPHPVSPEFRDMAASVSWYLPMLCALSSLLVHRVCVRYAGSENG